MEGLVGTTEFELTFPQLRFEKVANLIRDFHPGNLLDIGCGNGTATRGIRWALGLDVVDGVELLADNLTVPKWLRVVKLDVDKEDLPYPDGSFDAVYCGEIIEHLYDPDRMLSEVYRVLATEGVCAITTPNLASWPNRFMLPLGFQPYSTSVSFRHEQVGKLKLARTQGHRGHIRVFTPRALKELVKLHGFSIVKFEGWKIGDLSFYFSGRAGLLARLVGAVDKFFASFPSLASRLAMVIRK